MSTKVILPRSGMGIEEGTIFRWIKTVGDRVEQGEPIVEVESAKAMQEVEAPVAGVLVQILVHAGESVPVGSDLAVIE